MSFALAELAGEIRRYGLATDWRRGAQLGAILVSGADGPGFLQAQLTSDVRSLEPGSGQLSARLNRRGQLQAWFSLHRLPDRGQPFPVFLLILPVAEVPGLVADLTAFVITEDVRIEDMSGEFSGRIVQQPRGRELEDPAIAAWLGSCPTAVGGAWTEMAEYSLGVGAGPGRAEVWVIRRAFNGDPAFLILTPGPLLEASAATGEAELVDLDGLDEASAALLWRWLQAEAGWPRLDLDLPVGGRTLPQTGLEQQVVSLNKGCYLGQEVVARIRTYGSVPQALRAVIWRDIPPEELDTLPPAGLPCTDDQGRKRGTWAGSFWSPVLQAAASLAFLDREKRTPGTILACAGPDGALRGEVALLPLHQGASAPEQAAQLHDRALVHFSAGRDDEAVAGLEEALRLDPTRAEAFEALGVILGRQAKYHEAIAIFRRLEEVAPDEPMVHTNLSLFYAQIGEKDEAEHQKALATMKKFGVGVDAQQAAAMATAERQTRLEEAERKKAMFAEVLEIDPDDPLALMGMGQALTTLDDAETAVVYLQRALVRQDQNSALYASCGRVLEKLNRTAEAAEVFRAGIAVASRKGDLMPLKEMEHRLRLLDV